jgi:hypothetical protein
VLFGCYCVAGETVSRNKARRKKQETFLTYRWMGGLLRNGIQEMTEAHEACEKASAGDFARIVHFHRDRYGICLPERVVDWVESLESTDALAA